MVKPIVLTASADSAAAITAKMVLKADGSGGVAHDVSTANSTVAVGFAATDQDSEDNVGVVKQGLMKLPAAATTYSFGTKLGCNSSGVAAYASGIVAGWVAEPEEKVISTTYSSTDQLLVYVNVM
jgi:hypothetical protein